jgi:hypothetical protein
MLYRPTNHWSELVVKERITGDFPFWVRGRGLARWGAGRGILARLALYLDGRHCDLRVAVRGSVREIVRMCQQ